MWIVPANARGSFLVEVMNVTAEGDASERAWAERPLHPEDVGVDVSREDRRALIQAIDLGGQYYSRWNVEGGYDWASADSDN